MRLISIEAASVLTGISRRTFQRRLADGTIGKHGLDARRRSLINILEICGLLKFPLTGNDLSLLCDADAGLVEAQAELGQILYVLGHLDEALYWFRLAAEAGDSDAMQWMATCYLNPTYSRTNEHLALMWLSRAASAGHRIAIAQLEGLRQ